MQLLAYILAYPIIWFISILPFRILYFFSDVCYVIVYHIIRYRRKTVHLNLSLTLRHLTHEERDTVERKFYHHFCDNFFEMAKSLNISDKQLKKRFVFTNYELVHEYEAKNKSVVMLLGHYGSYEWLLYMNKGFRTHKGFGIYKIIRNKYFDKLVKKMRGRFHAELIGVRQTIPAMRQNERNGILGFYGFISDQSPKLGSTIHWGDFFGMEVPIHVGGEMLAKKIGMNMIFAKVDKTSRGHYKCTFVPVEENLKEIPNYEISDRFMKMLEQQIIAAPEYYLWTHKRFKHRRNDPPTA